MCHTPIEIQFGLRPELVAEIKFSDWTNEKIMRAPIFLRLREDKSPKECILEREKYTEKVMEKPVKEEKSRKKPNLDITK